MMKSKQELILEGSYSYYKKENCFATEEFKIINSLSDAGFQVFAEMTSKIEDEIFSIKTKYEIDEDFSPLGLMIEKSLGNKYVLEIFKVEKEISKLKYVLKTNSSEQEFHQEIPNIFHLSAPAFCSAMLWTHQLKTGTVTDSIEFIHSKNEWNYSEHPATKRIKFTLLSETFENYQLNNIPLVASKWELEDPTEKDFSKTEIFLSRDFSLPYELINPNLRITLTNLIRHS